MLKATIKDLAARKLRLLTTSMAVLLGVAFMAGTLVLTDTIGRTFDDLFTDVNAGTDAYVRAETAFSTEMGEERPRVEDDLVQEVAEVEGVAAVEGVVQGYAQLVDASGEPVGDPATGAPTFGGNWGEVDALNPFRLVEGRPPGAAGEVVIDKGSAEEGDLAVGDRTTVLTQAGAVEVEIVGIATFGEAVSPGGASYVMFTTAEAQRLLAEPGRFDAIAAVAAEGVSEEELTGRVGGVVPAGVEVLTGAEITQENQSEIEQALGFFNVFLLSFAVVALFVGSFIIYNTFSILVAQRGRELALLRAVGASRRQVLASVLIEAAVVGLLASLLGLVAGIGVAVALKALLSGFGFDIPAAGLVVSAGTVITSVVVGLVVSLSSAVLPARRAARLPPVAALRDVAFDSSGSSRTRIAAGAAIFGLGALSLAVGLVGDTGNAAALVGLGAAVVFVGVAVLGPVIARPVSRFIGAPLPALRGVAGTLARENAMRNPKRTSATAAALMVGVGLVGFITVFASSAKAAVDDAVDQAFVGDFVVDSGSIGFGGLSPELAGRLNEVPEVEVASGVRRGYAQVDGTTESLTAVDPATFAEVVEVGVTEGDLADLGESGMAVLAEEAADNGWSVGDRVPVRFADTGATELTVEAIYEEGELVGSYLVGLPAYEANFADQFDFLVVVEVAEGFAPADARSAIEAVTADYPTADLQDRIEYKAAQAGQIDQMLNLIYVLLALAIVIALLGIGNTLALSVFERTRELGLLRAVGMTRPQLRSTVRWESVIIALLGTVLGLLVGLFFGWAMVMALADEGLSELVVPVGQLTVMAVIAALAGVVAAVLPARRAARLDVLRAVTTE